MTESFPDGKREKKVQMSYICVSHAKHSLVQRWRLKQQYFLVERKRVPLPSKFHRHSLHHQTPAERSIRLNTCVHKPYMRVAGAVASILSSMSHSIGIL